MEQSSDLKRPYPVNRAKQSSVWWYLFVACLAHVALFGSMVGWALIKPLSSAPDDPIEVQLISFEPAAAEEVAPTMTDLDPGTVEPLSPPAPEPPLREPEPEPTPEPPAPQALPDQIAEPEPTLPQQPDPVPPPLEALPEPTPEPTPPAAKTEAASPLVPPVSKPTPPKTPPPPAPPKPQVRGAGGSTAESVAAKASTAASFDAAYLNNPAPRYPIRAFRQKAQGTVIVRAEVLPDGNSGKVVLHQSSGHESLDTAAVETVRKWRFQPATADGKPVKQWVNIPITFKLTER